MTMISAIDDRNTSAREKAGRRPYNKAFIVHKKACPDCDEPLEMAKVGDWATQHCQCASTIWIFDHTTKEWEKIKA